MRSGKGEGVESDFIILISHLFYIFFSELQFISVTQLFSSVILIFTTLNLTFLRLHPLVIFTVMNQRDGFNKSKGNANIYPTHLIHLWIVYNHLLKKSAFMNWSLLTLQQSPPLRVQYPPHECIHIVIYITCANAAETQFYLEGRNP